MAIAQYIVIREVVDGWSLAEPMFRRRYRHAAPDTPHHILAFANTQAGVWKPVAYLHCTDLGELMLGGGVCVDDRVLRELPTQARIELRQLGGLYRHALQWSMHYFQDRTKAIFGYCGDRLAERIDLAAGFSRTKYPNLLVHFTRDLEPAEQQRLVELANAQGPF